MATSYFATCSSNTNPSPDCDQPKNMTKGAVALAAWLVEHDDTSTEVFGTTAANVWRWSAGAHRPSGPSRVAIEHITGIPGRAWFESSDPTTTVPHSSQEDASCCPKDESCLSHAQAQAILSELRQIREMIEPLYRALK